MVCSNRRSNLVVEERLRKRYAALRLSLNRLLIGKSRTEDDAVSCQEHEREVLQITDRNAKY